MSFFPSIVSSKIKQPNTVFVIRYWLCWLLLLVVLAYGAHQYFEYRAHELDKRLEQIGR